MIEIPSGPHPRLYKCYKMESGRKVSARNRMETQRNAACWRLPRTARGWAWGCWGWGTPAPAPSSSWPAGTPSSSCSPAGRTSWPRTSGRRSENKHKDYDFINSEIRIYWRCHWPPSAKSCIKIGNSFQLPTAGTSLQSLSTVEIDMFFTAARCVGK